MSLHLICKKIPLRKVLVMLNLDREYILQPLMKIPYIVPPLMMTRINASITGCVLRSTDLSDGHIGNGVIDEKKLINKNKIIHKTAITFY